MSSINDPYGKLNVLVSESAVLHAKEEQKEAETKVSACDSIGDNLSDGQHKHRDNLYLGLQLLQALDKNSTQYAAVEAKVVGLFDKLTEEAAK